MNCIYCFCMKDIPKAFLPLGEALVPTQEKKKTQDLKKIGNFKKIPEMFGFDGEYSAVKPKVKY